MTVLHRNSKADTVFLAEPLGAGSAALAQDLSEQRTDLVDNTTYVSEAASARTALAAPRTICLIVDMTTTSSGVLVHHGASAAVYGYAIDKATGFVRISQNATILLTLAVPGLAAGARSILVHWAQREEGAQRRSELVLYNFDTDQWAHGSATHSAFAPSAAHAFTLGAVTGGGSAYSLGPGAFGAVAVSRRFHAATEAALDWVAVPVPPAMPGRRRTPLRTGADLRIAAEGDQGGPSYLWAVSATRQADSRLLTALVNLVIPNPYREVHAATARYTRAAPGAPAYRLCTRWLWHAWPGPQANAARVRIHVAVTSPGGPVSPIQIRMYSIAHLPTGQAGQIPPLVYFFTSTQTIAAATAAEGAWLDLGQVRLAVDGFGMTALALALSFNNGGADPHGTEVVIRAVTVEPLHAELSGGGFGDFELGDG